MGTLFGKQKTTLRKSLMTFGVFFVTLLLFSSVGITQVAAQGSDSGQAANPTPYIGGPYNGPGPVINGTINPATGTVYPAPGGGGGADSGQATAVNTADAAATEIPQFDDPLYKLLYGFVITVFGTIFAWSGAIFDIGLNKFLLGFGDLYYNHNVGVAVEETWKIVRDLFNLTFIFGLVYIGFKMILDADDHHGRKMLVNLIGAALLVNFSLFIIKFLIDISDITAAVIAKGFSTTTSISNAFINVINLGTILKLSGEQIAALQTSGAFAYIFGIMIFLAVASFVFAAGGILLIIRFIVLNIYLVFSPIMFIGWVFPSFAHHSKKYMDGFLAQAFFAPAYLLMLYLSFKVLSTYADVQDVNYGALFVDGPVKANSAEMAIPFFILAMIFLVASLVVAKNMGAVGASTAVSIGDSWRKKITTGMQNTATYLPRAGGRIATNYAGEKAEKGLNRLQARGGALSWVARTNTADKLLRGAAGSASHAKFGTGTTNKDERAYAEGIRGKVNQTQDEKKRESELARTSTVLADATLGTTELTKAMEDLGKTVKKLSADEKAKLGFTGLNQADIALHITDEELEAMKKSGKLTNQQAATIIATRGAAQTSIAATGSTSAALVTANPSRANATFINSQREALMNRSVQDAGKMPVTLFMERNMTPYITPQALQERMKNGGVLSSQLATIRTNIESYASSASPQVKSMWKKWSENTTYGAQSGITIP